MSAESIEPKVLLDSLVNANVIVPQSDGEELAMSTEFLEATERLDDEFDSSVTSLEPQTTFAETASRSTLILVEAIDQFVPEFDADEAVQVALTLRRWEQPPKTAGVPTGFTPLLGDELSLFLERHPGAVVYCWREGCDPCDIVREDLAALVEDKTIPPEIGLGAVYGPNHLDFIANEYAVKAAPTILFCVGSTVDSRLVGPYPADAIQNEISIITERASIDA